MLQDLLLQIPQLGGRFEPNLVEQVAPEVPIYRQCVGVPAAEIQGGHQLSVRAFPQRMCANERLQLGDELVMSTECEHGISASLHRHSAQPVQARHIRP